ERTEQTEFAQPLGDGDRERVVDDERTDEERDEGEDEQQRVEERQVALHVVRLLRGELSPRDRLVGQPLRTERAADVITNLRLREAAIAAHVDLIPLPDAVHHFLRSRWSERGEGGTRKTVLLAAEFEDAGDRELARLDREEGDLGAVAHLELPVHERPLVEGHLVRGSRLTPAPEIERSSRRALR